jgi:hypothetical protein
MAQNTKVWREMFVALLTAVRTELSSGEMICRKVSAMIVELMVRVNV